MVGGEVAQTLVRPAATRSTRDTSSLGFTFAFLIQFHGHSFSPAPALLSMGSSPEEPSVALPGPYQGRAGASPRRHAARRDTALYHDAWARSGHRALPGSFAVSGSNLVGSFPLTKRSRGRFLNGA